MRIIRVGHETLKVIIDIVGDLDDLMRSAFVLVLHYYLKFLNTHKSLADRGLTRGPNLGNRDTLLAC